MFCDHLITEWHNPNTPENNQHDPKQQECILQTNSLISLTKEREKQPLTLMSMGIK